jgi:hypothetical protein
LGVEEGIDEEREEGQIMTHCLHLGLLSLWQARLGAEKHVE